MKIHYIECLDKKKLFSFYRHDFIEHTDKWGNYYMLDGGLEDYYRYSYPIEKLKGGKTPITESEISEVIFDIRKQFKWTKNYDKNNKLLVKPQIKKLKDLTTSHILGILKYFTEKLIITTDVKDPQGVISKEWKTIHCIFLEELLYRKKKKLL